MRFDKIALNLVLLSQIKNRLIKNVKTMYIYNMPKAYI